MTNTQFLRRADDRVIDFDIPVCSCSIVRNELVRLPYLLEYHRKLGIKQFFFIDNLSTDGTLDYIKSQPDCIPLIAESSFRDAHGGSLWIQEAIFKFGRNRWWLTLDADELFTYPHADEVSMEQFCSYLNSIGAEGVFTILLDMYSKQPVAEAVYHAGQPFTDVCPYFDGNYTWRNRLNPRLWQQAFPPMEPIGGPRLRLFYPEFLNKGVATYTMAKIKRALRDKAKKLGAHLNMECAVPPLLFKVPLIKATGQHLPINPHKTTPLRLADVTTALLHFKFFSFFHEYAAESVARKQHFDGASEYKRYLNVLKINPTISLYGAASTLYEEPETLVKHNIMQTSNAYETYATRRKAA